MFDKNVRGRVVDVWQRLRTEKREEKNPNQKMQNFAFHLSVCVSPDAGGNQESIGENSRKCHAHTNCT